jgi:hypothetical protein
MFPEQTADKTFKTIRRAKKDEVTPRFSAEHASPHHAHHVTTTSHITDMEPVNPRKSREYAD